MPKTSVTVRVDVEVYEALKGMAEPFTDSPNKVLRRLLGLDQEENRREDGAHRE